MSSTNAQIIHDAILEAKIAAGRQDIDKSNIFHLANLFAIPGDHLEIGTLHGASAIAVALAKKMAGVPGEVYCIDPLSGRPDNPRVNPLHKNSDPKPEIILANAKKFDVKLNLIREKSYPWPKELEGNTFATAYIDGDHRYPWPHHDWGSLRKRVTRYIALDDYWNQYGPSIKALIAEILLFDPAWELTLKSGRLVVLGRPELLTSFRTYGDNIDLNFHVQ